MYECTSQRMSRLFASVAFGRAVAVPSQADSCTNVCVLVFLLCVLLASHRSRVPCVPLPCAFYTFCERVSP